MKKLYLDKCTFGSDEIQEIRDYMNKSKKNVFVCTVSLVKSKRNNDQNDLLHKLCREFVVVAQETAIVFNEFDSERALDLSNWKMDHFKAMFAKLYLTTTCPTTGVEIIKATSSLTVDQFRKFLNSVVDDFLHNGGVMLKKDKELYKSAMGV